MTKTLESAAIAVLPETLDENVPLPWHNNPELQQLQQQRDTMSRTDPVYKKLTKKHRILLKRLKNQYYAEEANAINSLARARNIEQTFRRMKQDALTDVPTSGCDQNLLREHFKKHFTCDTSKKTPDSLISNRPEFMESLLAIQINLPTMIKNGQNWTKKAFFRQFFGNWTRKTPKVTPKSPPVFVQWAKTELLRHVRAFFT